MTDWLNPLNRIRIQNAVRSKAPQVQLMLPHHRLFNVDYSRENGKVQISPDRLVSIAESDLDSNLIPRGTFDIATITDAEWLIVVEPRQSA